MTWYVVTYPHISGIFIPLLIPQPDWDKFHFFRDDPIKPYLRFLGLQGLIPLRDQSREMDNTGAGDIPAACPGTLPRTGSPKELQPPPPQPHGLSICDLGLYQTALQTIQARRVF